MQIKRGFELSRLRLLKSRMGRLNKLGQKFFYEKGKVVLRRKTSKVPK